jgi:hypothetical protein
MWRALPRSRAPEDDDSCFGILPDADVPGTDMSAQHSGAGCCREAQLVGGRAMLAAVMVVQRRAGPGAALAPQCSQLLHRPHGLQQAGCGSTE